MVLSTANAGINKKVYDRTRPYTLSFDFHSSIFINGHFFAAFFSYLLLYQLFLQNSAPAAGTAVSSLAHSGLVASTGNPLERHATLTTDNFVLERMGIITYI